MVDIFDVNNDSDISSVCANHEVTAREDQDGAGLYSQFVPGNNVVDYVAAPDGTHYYFDPSSLLLTKIEDANGNYVTVTGLTGAGPEIWTDATGKVVLEIYKTQFAGTGGPYLPTIIDTFNSSGQTQEYIATWTYEQSSGYTLNHPSSGSYCEYCEVGGSLAVSAYELTALELPDGSSYSISYDSTTGAVSKIAYPQGGYVQFAYGDAPDPANCIMGDPDTGKALEVACDQLAATDEWRNDGTNTWHWTYAYSSGPYSSEIVAVTDPLGQTTTYNYAAYMVAGSTKALSDLPLETQRTVAAANGAALRVITTQYVGIRPVAVQTQLADAGSAGPVASEVDYSWDAYGNQLGENDYNYAACSAPSPPVTSYGTAFGCGPGTLLRQTVRTFLADTGPWILNRPVTETIYDGGGNPKAETTWEYDVYSGANHAALTSSGAVNHDSAYNAGGSIVQRGNNTAISRCVTFSGASCASSLTSYGQYDDAGNRVLDIDAAGNHTEYSFADAWANGTCAPSGGQAASFLMQVTDALGHTTKGTYNSCTGELATYTDENSNVTSFTYADPFNRLTQINYPDGGETTYAYTPNTRETKRLQDTGGDWMDGLETVDGLGSPTVSATLTSPGQWSRVDTCYDGAGAKSFASYPYYSSSNGGAPNCSGTGDAYQYDALQRPTVTTHSDSSTFLTSYAGPATETQDEGNGSVRITRISQTNGIGQLSDVCEVTFSTPPSQGPAPGACGLDISGTGYLTTYQDDPLNNLLQVGHGAETRSFSYDGLSRLTSATNPETGNTLYAWDAPLGGGYCAGQGVPASAGDLVQRNDARGVATCYQYDPLHRLTQRSYNVGTLPVAYAWDTTTLWGGTLHNDIGRLSYEMVGTGSQTVDVISYDRDAMGRVVHQGGCTPATCGSGGFGLSPTYDLAGDVVTMADPWGRTLATTYDLAGRPISLSSSTQGTLISGVSYDARGNELSATLGNGTGESRGYDARGRALSVTDGGAYSWSVTSLAPDGDVLASSDSVNGAYTFTFNDLNQMPLYCNSGGCSTWISFDRYGNRWSPGLSFNGGINQFDGYSYDAAGNMLYDGFHSYSYDAENRLISVDGGSTATYVYDAEGRRVHESVGGAVKEYIYGQTGQELTVVDGNQNLVAGETYLGGRYLGTQQASTGAFAWAEGDGLGTVRARASVPCGGNCETYTSDPWGSNLSQVGAISNLHFTGKYRDGEDNLDYFGARYYNSWLGRFMTPDWSESPEPVPYANLENPQSLNLYSYVRDNPVSVLDSDGHDIWEKGCGDNSSTSQGGYVGTTDENGVFTRTHLTGDQTANASLGIDGITVGKYEGVWDTNVGEGGAVTVAGAGDLSDFNAVVTGDCTHTCIASGSLEAQAGGPASRTDVRSILDGNTSWSANKIDIFHMHGGTVDVSYNGIPGTDGPSTDITVPRRDAPVEFHVNSGYPFQDAYQMGVHVLSILHTFGNAIGGLFGGSGQ